MDQGITIDDTQFQQTLRRYADVSSRTITDIVNKKAFFIARGAVRNTPKVPKEKIEQELGKIVSIHEVNKKGRLVKRTALAGTFTGPGQSFDKPGPRAALILTAKRAASGQPSIFKGKSRAAGAADMALAVLKFVRRRRSSTAYLASGWLEAIKTLGGLVKDRRGITPFTPGIRQWGYRKGSVQPAAHELNPTCTIVNSTGRWAEESRALQVYGLPALQQAVNAEEASMRGEIEKRLREEAQGQGIHTN